jgi:hypothetical protein
MSEWQDKLVAAFPGIEPGTDLDVAFNSPDQELLLGLRAGQLHLGDRSRAGGPDMEFRFHGLAVRDVLFGKLAMATVFDDAKVRAGGPWDPALPAGECDLPASGSFEHIPGASMLVGISVNGTVFGAVGLRERWHDGALVSSELVSLNELQNSDLDVQMACSLVQLAAIRRRELTPLDAMAAGVGVAADWPKLMCFMELVGHPAFAPVWADEVGILAQAAWGAVFCSSAFGDAALKARLDSVVAP